jgi:hypothetical protein
MSSTNRGGVREENDFYETRRVDSIEMIRRLAKRFTPAVIVEPMAGRGALVRVMRDVWPQAKIVANELNEERASQLKDAGADVVLVGDMFRQSLRSELPVKIDLILTNPAFKFAFEAAQKCIPWADHTVLLQRLGWLGSAERLPFWSRERYDFGILAQRPSFAASLSCGRVDGKGKAKVKRPCGWAVIQYLDAPRAESCPGCGEGVNVSTSDSADYAWYDFYAGSKNQHFHLGHVEQVEQGQLLGVA